VSRETPDSSRGGGLKLQTLLLSAVSAVAAATIVPLFWEKGTVIATAMTPVLVALVTEALRRPVERVSAVAPKVAVAPRAAVRRFESSTTQARRPERVTSRRADRGPAFDPLGDAEVGAELRPSAGRVPGEDPFGLREPAPRRSWWKVGLVTGVLAFVLAAAVVTASELTIFGGSVSGERGRTTLFGGGHEQSRPDTGDRGSPSRSATPQPDATATPDSTAEPTATPTPAETSTPAPTATATPTPAGPASAATPTP
jgi:hypothetical protein